MHELRGALSEGELEVGSAKQIMGEEKMIRALRAKASSRQGIDKEEILWILDQEDPALIDEISSVANGLREDLVGNQACIHGIIEFSNFCRRNCMYCGLRVGNNGLKRYRLSADEIVETAEAAVRDYGYKMFVLQSGEDLDYSTDDLVDIVKRIFDSTKTLIFLSIGERDITTYRKLYLAGARGVLFRFETSSLELYSKMHPGVSHKERLKHLKFLKETGYIVATGPIVGLRGQTRETYADDITMIRDSGALMVSFGPFIPHPDTPLADSPVIDPAEVRKFIIALRLAMPRIRIPVTTAMEHLWGDDFRKVALRSGANSFMLNLTPAGVRENYDIYPGKNIQPGHVHTLETFDCVMGIMKECGMELCRGFGLEFELTEEVFSVGCSMDDR